MLLTKRFLMSLILTSAAMPSAFAENQKTSDADSVVKDSQVDTGAQVTLGDYFAKTQANDKTPFIKKPAFAIGAGAGGLGVVRLLLLRSQIKTLRAEFLMMTTVGREGLSMWGSDDALDKEVARLRSKFSRNKVLSTLSSAGLIYLFCDGFAGVYVMTKGYEPKFVGNMPSLVKYMIKSPEGVDLLAKDFDPRGLLQESEKDQIKREFDQLKSGVMRTIDSIRPKP